LTEKANVSQDLDPSENARFLSESSPIEQSPRFCIKEEEVVRILEESLLFNCSSSANLT